MATAKQRERRNNLGIARSAGVRTRQAIDEAASTAVETATLPLRKGIEAGRAIVNTAQTVAEAAPSFVQGLVTGQEVAPGTPMQPQPAPPRPSSLRGPQPVASTILPSHADTRQDFSPEGGRTPDTTGFRQIQDADGNIILTNVAGDSTVRNEVSNLRGRNIAGVVDGQELRNDRSGAADLSAIDTAREITDNRHTGQPDHGQFDLRKKGGGSSDTLRHFQNVSNAERIGSDFQRTRQVAAADIPASTPSQAGPVDRFKPAVGEGAARTTIATTGEEGGLLTPNARNPVSRDMLNRIGADLAKQSPGPSGETLTIGDSQSSLGVFIDRINKGKRSATERNIASETAAATTAANIKAANDRLLEQQKAKSKTFTLSPGQIAATAGGDIVAQGQAKEFDHPEDVMARYQTDDGFGGTTTDTAALGAFNRYYTAIGGKGNSREAQAELDTKVTKAQSMGAEWLQAQIQANPQMQEELEAIYLAAFPPQTAGVQ